MVCIRALYRSGRRARAKALRRAPAFPTMQSRAEKTRRRPSQHPLRTTNALGRRLTRGRLLLYEMLVPLAIALVHAVWRWCRAVRVTGAEHIIAALERAPSFIPVYWHQHQLFCVKQLLELRQCGREIGIPDQPLGRWRARRHAGAQARRRGDPRLLELYRRARAARLLSGARAARVSPRPSRRTVRADRRGSSSRVRSCSRSCRSGPSFPWRSPLRAPGRSNGTDS